MSTITNNGPYPPLTIYMDVVGSLHMWKGSVLVNRSMPLKPMADHREADLFEQAQENIEAIISHLTDDERESIKGCWPTVVTTIPDDYLGCE